jgi:hypothetical protein
MRIPPIQKFKTRYFLEFQVFCVKKWSEITRCMEKAITEFKKNLSSFSN